MSGERTSPAASHITARKTYGHVSDGMICSARGARAGGGRPTGSSCSATRTATRTTTASVLRGRAPTPWSCSGSGTPSWSWPSRPTGGTPCRCGAWRARSRRRSAARSVDPGAPDALRRPVADSDDGWEVRLPDPGCARYVARLVEGLDPAARSPLAWQSRLLRAGMRPVSGAVDVTNLVMLELGQPLHAFDADRLSGAVVVRRAAAGERLVTLDGVDRALHPDDLVIADDTGPVALAGVMGGEATELRVGETTRVLLESAHFDPVSVARTARRHGLPSEASRRFERGVDPALPARAAQRAVELLAQVAGAVDTGRVTDAGAVPEAAEVPLPADLPGRTAGVPYPAAVVVARLRDVGCEVVGDGTDGTPLAVRPPSWRPDLTDPADLVEEVVRLEGYEGLPSVLPTAPGGRGLRPEQRGRRRAADALATAGFVEVPSYPFVGQAGLDALGLPADDERRRTVRLANPLSEEESALRTTLLPGLAATALRNRSRGTPDLALFEVGTVFRVPADGLPDAPRPSVERAPTPEEMAALDAALPAQPRHVAVLLCGQAEPAGWWGPGRSADWTDAVDAARLVAEAVGAVVDVRADDVAPWHPGRCAALLVGSAVGVAGDEPDPRGDPGQQVVGHAGELHPRVCAALGLPPRTVAAELDLDLLVSVGRGAAPAPAVSPYPAARLDVALAVPAEVAAADVHEALQDGAAAAGDEDLLESLGLFDVWTGPPLAEGERSLAFALRLRASDRTLTAAETAEVRDAAVAEAASRTGARLRT